MARNRRIVAGLALASLAGCIRVERTSSSEPIDRGEVLARGQVTAALGGTLTAEIGGEFEGVQLIVPPGAVPTDVEVVLRGRFGDPRLPSIVQTIEVEPQELQLGRAAQLTLRYSTTYARTAGQIWPESEVEIYGFQTAPTEDERVEVIADRNTDNHTIDASITRFGTFYAMHPVLRGLVSQPTRLIDPAEPLTARLIDGQLRLSSGGDVLLGVGEGRLGEFWSAPAERNLVIVPGLLTDPLVASSAGGPTPLQSRGGLELDFANVVVFQYPTGRSFQESGNALYDLLQASARPGFGCRLLAHGTGGLVARQAIERAHADPTRLGYAPGQPKLDTLIDRAVLIATPNQGASVAQSRFDYLLAGVFPADQPFVQGVVDLLPGPASFVERLNDGWVEPQTEYFAIAGDFDGSHQDGLVDVTSALGLPTSTARPEGHQVFSGPIYEHAALYLFSETIGVLDQARTWFGKARGNTPAIVGAVQTPADGSRGVIDIPIRVTDPEGAGCLVLPMFSVDNGEWRFARGPVGSSFLIVRGAAAPGTEEVFRWDSRADGAGLAGPSRVTFRFLIQDGNRPGIAGQSGEFLVDNSTP
ncbi:MAG: esterase/lipase family protein [Planctomycetota bacterium]|jgi:hypothetical protein